MKPLDIRDLAIIDAFPVYDCKNIVLNIGCGEGRIDFHLAVMGYRIYATDVRRYDTWIDKGNPSFHVANILDVSSFPVVSAPIVICNQVLEHLEAYETALVNMMALAETRIVITIPYRTSFSSPNHLHFWDDKESEEYKDVNEFKRICHPNSVAISKIRTNARDAGKKRRYKMIYAYLITIDKRQNLMDKGL